MKLNIPDMECGGCANSVTKALQAIDGDATVDADLDAKTVTLTTTASEDAVFAALDDAGFPATAA